ncbi:MAG: hypothetical protein KME03_19075 [Aphanocapsa lilacina HA4352-LM1]|jgi:hypothetical protein|nr:hypothetical protein [Aphanocapsa lilacina HA4352-LM1]
MAPLSEQTLRAILNLQGHLLSIVNQAGAVEDAIFRLYGESAAPAAALEQMKNVAQRSASAYTKLGNLLLRISEAQPSASTAILKLLTEATEQAKVISASAAQSITETRRDWNL